MCKISWSNSKKRREEFPGTQFLAFNLNQPVGGLNLTGFGCFWVVLLIAFNKLGKRKDATENTFGKLVVVLLMGSGSSKRNDLGAFWALVGGGGVLCAEPSFGRGSGENLTRSKLLKSALVKATVGDVLLPKSMGTFIEKHGRKKSETRGAG